MIKENSYFDAQVKSLAFRQDDGESSVGVMLPGTYQFGTGKPEKMTVVKGELIVKREGEQEWASFKAGDAFNVTGDSFFDVEVKVATAYLCEYL
ncbi:pyrimidine/purine nucleoside phosphorylase [Vibrio hippocampi]|uniref:Pyrimidine/purine nucleoside phosphorylase n=1 Tax=Vibrio hippocampi TaxID=654686 RepID=A0ABM8ZNV6_9VIBR|nr:pyrimidine/purine nucleoside phosphorylase [Vibrio hippocampi]CAH0530225.1 Pyrimidine/purine nucleoside phosphorylase [Vibrio hippocampi]